MNNNIIELKKDLDFCKKQRAFAIKMARECSAEIKTLIDRYDRNDLKLPASMFADSLNRHIKELNRYKWDALFWRADMQELLTALKGCN